MNPELLNAARAALGPSGSPGGAAAYWVPGRIEVLGKHTDYAGGRSLVCAAEHGFVIVAAPRPDSLVRVINVAESREVTLALDPALPDPPGAWTRYPAAVLRRRHGPAARRPNRMTGTVPVATPLARVSRIRYVGSLSGEVTGALVAQVDRAQDS